MTHLRCAIGLSLFLSGAIASPALATEARALPKLNLKVASSTEFMYDLRAHVMAGKGGVLPQRIAKQVRGVSADHRHLVSELVAHGLTGYVEQAIEAEKQSKDGAFPEARSAYLDESGRARQPLPLPETAQVATRVSIRDFHRRYMAAQQDPKVLAATEHADSAGKLQRAGVVPYSAVVAADAARSKTLATVRAETLGAGSVAAFEGLSGEAWRNGLNHGGDFDDTSRMQTIAVRQPPRPASQAVGDYSPNLYNTIRRLDFQANAVIRDEPTPNTMRAAMNKMMNRPAEYLAVYALTHDLFATAGEAKALQAAAKKLVAAIPHKERDFFVLFSEMSRLREARAGVTGPTRDAQVLQALADALGAKAPVLGKSAVRAERSPSGYALGLMINNERGGDAWNASKFGIRRVEYQGLYTPPWLEMKTK
jgi:hypothetical protein